MIHKNNLSEDYKNSALTVEQRIESVGDNLVKVNSELELHQNQLYYIKKGIVQKAMAYYQDAKPAIKENLIEAFQEMEYAFVTNEVSAFCSAVYRQMEVICNHVLFVSRNLNDNILFDAVARKCAVQPNHGLNALSGSFVWETNRGGKSFINFAVPAEKEQYFSRFYLQTVSKSGTCQLRISFANKLNLIYGFYIHKPETNPNDNSVVYYFYNNNFVITNKVKEIRDAKEHGLQSNYLSGWTAKDYFEALKVLHDLYQKIPDLK